MANEEIRKESVANEETKTDALRVYKKKSTYKGAGENDFYYSATLSSGDSATLKFKCEIETESMAFEIYDIFGSRVKKQVEKNNETYTNWTYYITSCKFREIIGEPLPF